MHALSTSAVALALFLVAATARAEPPPDAGVDPLFISATDYHLQSTSPLINAGTASNAPATDYDGDARVAAAGRERHQHVLDLGDEVARRQLAQGTA